MLTYADPMLTYADPLLTYADPMFIRLLVSFHLHLFIYYFIFERNIIIVIKYYLLFTLQSIVSVLKSI